MKIHLTRTLQVEEKNLKEYNYDDNWNQVEDYELYLTKQLQEQDEISIWFTLVKLDKHGNNVMQLDFDDLSVEDLSNFINGVIRTIKEK